MIMAPLRNPAAETFPPYFLAAADKPEMTTMINWLFEPVP